MKIANILKYDNGNPYNAYVKKKSKIEKYIQFYTKLMFYEKIE